MTKDISEIVKNFEENNNDKNTERVKCFYCKKKIFKVMVNKEENKVIVLCNKCGAVLLNITHKENKEEIRK